MPDPGRLPDAIKIYAGRNAGLQSIQQEFGPLFGGRRLHVKVMGTFNFVTDDPHQTLGMPSGHAREKQDRYEWVKRGDKLEFGYLLPDAAKDDHITYGPAAVTLAPPPEDVLGAMLKQGVISQAEHDAARARLAEASRPQPAPVPA
jgi:hypothetical protein